MKLSSLLTLKHPLWFVPPLALGVFLVANAVQSRAPLEPRDLPEEARPLGVVTVALADLRPSVRGYGSVRPARVWTAVARVGGSVAATDPRLDSGLLVDAGAELLRIEAVDYEIAVAQARADVAALEAQVAELEQSAENDRRLLEVERRSVAAAERESARTAELVPSGTVSASAADASERSLLAQRASSTNVQSRLELVPARRAALEAASDAARARLAGAELDVERTRIVAPFGGRLVGADVELDQFVAPNQRLFDLHAVDAVEIDVRLLPEDVERLGGSNGLLDAPARVSVPSDVDPRPMDGRVVRVREQLERRTGTLGVVVRVESVDGTPVPLLDGTFCDVELLGEPVPDRLRVPRSAVRGGQLFVVDDQDRARRLAVAIEGRQGDDLLVASGLVPGARVVAVYPVGLPAGALAAPVELDQ